MRIFIFLFLLTAKISVSQCNLTVIRSAYTGAGCTELLNCNDGCSLYFYYPTMGSSQAAETFAQSLGGHLVSVQSFTQNNCFRNELNTLGFTGNVWIGYNDNVLEGTFYWLDGKPVGYTNWASGEPNNSGPNEDCVQLFSDGSWHDVDCASTAGSIIEVGLCPQASVNSNTTQICVGSSATLSVSTLFGSAPYSYSWSPTAGLSSNTTSNTIASPSVTTNYTVQSTDKYGCVAYAFVTVTVNAAPTLTVNFPTICNKGTATLTVSGASTYSWIPTLGLSSSTGSLVTTSPSVTTIYTVTGTNSFGCSKSISTFVKVNPLPNINTTTSPTAVCIGQQPATITSSGALTYSWIPAAGLSSTTGATVTASPPATKTYTVFGTNSFGCINYTTAIVTINTLPNISVSDASICVGQQTATLTATGANTYAWIPTSNLSSNSGSVVLANPNSTTTYTVLGTDINGCKNYTTVKLTVMPLPVVTSSNASICFGQTSTTLIANGANTYTWNPASGLSSATGSLVVGTPTATTIYTVTGTSLVGCKSSTTIFIKVNTLPTITAAASASAICMGQQSSNLTASGAVSYTWAPTLGLSSSTGSNVIANPLATKTYSVFGTNTFGCVNYTTTTITVNALPTINVNVASICLGQQTATLIANGANTYAWAPANSLTPSTGSLVVANPSASTTYSILGTDVNGCKNFVTTKLTVLDLPLINTNNPSICTGQQSATIIATGAMSYSWMPASNLSTTNGSVVVANPTVTTVYSVTGTAANGCYNSSNANVSMQSLPTVVATSGTICMGQQTANLEASGALTYSWMPNLNLSSATGSLVGATPSVTSTYTVEGTDSNGCNNVTTTTVTVLGLPILSVTNSSICLGQQVATLTVSGANTYTWLPSLTTGSVINVEPTVNSTYSVIGTDLSGCMNYTVGMVFINSLPSISATSMSICVGQQTATLIASGGIAYVWTPTNSLNNTTGSLVTGTPSVTTDYTVVGTDANGCFDYTTTTVIVNELPILIVSSSSVCSGQQPANVLVFGANSYTWQPTVIYNQPDGSDISTNPLVPTDYTVTGIDVYGCTNTAITNVGFFEIPVASLAVSDSFLCVGESFVLTPLGGTSFELQPDNLFSLDNFSLSPTATSSYTLIVYTDDGCHSENNAVVTVTVNPDPIITAFTNTVINIGQTTSMSALGGLTYEWMPTDGLSCFNCAQTNAKPTESTFYVVRGFDANGCSNTDTVFVQVDYNCGEYFVPNVFTPNGDGMNDVVNLYNACISNYKFQVFDRWGEKIFETSDVNDSWNGDFKGKPMDTGVFMYKADGFDLKGTAFSVKGNVTLLR